MSYTNNMKKMVTDHDSMKTWHDGMAKSAADSMQDHIKAAAWHAAQADMLKGMINDVPLDPEKKSTSIPTSGAAPTPTSGAGYTSPEKEVPLDPSTVKKSDLISVLSQHAKEHGDFDMDIESIANFLMAE
jgi:hypothetical protein